jgi:hypothetical protein
MRGASRDLLITSGATIALGRRRARYQADHPVPVRPRLGLLRADRGWLAFVPAGPRRTRRSAPAAAAGRLVRKTAGPARAHARFFLMAVTLPPGPAAAAPVQAAYEPPSSSPSGLGAENSTSRTVWPVRSRTVVVCNA